MPEETQSQANNAADAVQAEPTTPATQPSAPAVTPKAKSHKPSITGIILSVLALLSSGIANVVIHVKYTPKGPTTGSIDREVGHAVATGTTTVLDTIFALPFMIVGLVLGILAIIFIVIRLWKVKVVGAVLSVVGIGLAIWAISISITLFDLIKAHPQ